MTIMADTAAHNVSNPDTKGRKIMIADEDLLACDLMQYSLENEGYKVEVFHSAKEAMDKNLAGFSLFIIDMNLGDSTGIKLAYHLKQNKATARIPLIFCSTPDGDEIGGLDFGADDYILKPFSMREMTARVNALLRRCRIGTSQEFHDKPSVLSHNTLTLNLRERTTFIDSIPIKLGRDEFGLLAFLLSHKNRIFDADEIYDNAWPEKDTVSEVYINNVLDRIRAKLGRYSHYLVTRYGYGYGFIQ